jgi:hypothetical protein
MPYQGGQHMLVLLELHFASPYFFTPPASTDVCARAMADTVFPGRYGIPNEFFKTRTLQVPVNEGSVQTVYFPESVDVDDDSANLPYYGSEMYSLLDMKRRVINTLLQYEGFRGLSAEQIRLAKHLMLANLKN